MATWEILLTEANPTVLAALAVTYWRLRGRINRVENRVESLSPGSDGDTAAD